MLIKDSPRLTPGRDSYFKNLLYGLRPSVVRENPQLYLSFAAFSVFSIAVQVFFPYLIIYIQNYLGIKDYAIVLGVVLIFASVVSVVSGRFIDRVGKMHFTVPAAAIMLIGLAAMYFVRGNAGVMVAGSVMMSGYMMMSAALGANIRDWTPKDKAGHFQGIRMIFAVMLPMIIGPRDWRGGHPQFRQHLYGAWPAQDRAYAGDIPRGRGSPAADGGARADAEKKRKKEIRRTR